MINRRYRKGVTNNAMYGTPDYGRLDGIALRRCKDLGVSDVNFFNGFRQLLSQKYDDTRKTEGVCGGMVCEWSCLYLILEDPELALPVEAVSAQLQGHQEMTSFKRHYAEKQKVDSTARKKMYESQGLMLTKVLFEGNQTMRQMPASTNLFNNAVAEIADRLTECVPHLLSVSAGPWGNRHAIGLVLHKTVYYVLEPNEGLFRLPTRDHFVSELTNHFIQDMPQGLQLQPKSKWKMKSIEWQPHYWDHHYK